MTQVDRAECQDLGIPQGMIPVFRDYVARTNRRQIDDAPLEVRMAVLAGLADAFLANLKPDQKDEARRSRMAAEKDQKESRRRRRKRHKGKEEPLPKPVDTRKLGAVPMKALPGVPPPSMARQGFGNPGELEGALREARPLKSAPRESTGRGDEMRSLPRRARPEPR